MYGIHFLLHSFQTATMQVFLHGLPSYISNLRYESLDI